MTSMLTTGDVARTTGLSEKAVRLYTDRGLLEAARDPRSDARRHLMSLCFVLAPMVARPTRRTAAKPATMRSRTSKKPR